MHPFSLKQENTKDVTGGLSLTFVTFGIHETGEGFPKPFPVPTTQAIGEEGGFPIHLTY